MSKKKNNDIIKDRNTIVVVNTGALRYFPNKIPLIKPNKGKSTINTSIHVFTLKIETVKIFINKIIIFNTNENEYLIDAAKLSSHLNFFLSNFQKVGFLNISRFQ